MDALLNAADPAAAPVHAVVTTEQQLFQRGPRCPTRRTLWPRGFRRDRPRWPTTRRCCSTALAVQEQVTAASEFARFLRKPEQLGDLAKLRLPRRGRQTPKSDVTTSRRSRLPLSVGDSAMRATLANALTAPAGNPAVTIMLDQSMPADEGGKTRLANVVAALDARIADVPPTSAVGLWTFDGVEGRSEVATGPLSDQVDGSPRTAALTAALDEQTASGGGAVSFTTLRLVYDDALANFREGQTNSVLVITAGPHTDQTLDGSGLQDYVASHLRPGQAGRDQRDRLRRRPRPRDMGGGRPGQRRQLPEPPDVGVAGAGVGGRHVPRLARRFE